MEIEEFEKKVNELVPMDEEEQLFEKELEFYLAADGCLSCKYNGEGISCEGVPWSKALDLIIKEITKIGQEPKIEPIEEPRYSVAEINKIFDAYCEVPYSKIQYSAIKQFLYLVEDKKRVEAILNDE